MTTVGLQIPNFTFPDVDPADLFERVARIATTAEEHGADTVFVMDHFFQLPMLGPPEFEMFEAYTLLGALAARTTSARLGTLVTGVTYRNPAILAKQVTALDVISGGRALLGIGAAWFDVEHHAFHVDFPPLTERYERLEDALQICRAMFTETTATVAGTHHSVTDAWNSPRPITPGGPPILVGGTGERKTFRIAAQYADELNINSSFSELPRKLDALDRHLHDLGRDRSDISVSCLGTMVIRETHDEAEAAIAALLRSRGVNDPSDVLDEPTTRAQVLPRMFVGDPDEVGAQVAELLDLGLDGVVVNLPPDPTLSAGRDHGGSTGEGFGILDTVALAMQTLASATAAARTSS